MLMAALLLSRVGSSPRALPQQKSAVAFPYLSSVSETTMPTTPSPDTCGFRSEFPVKVLHSKNVARTPGSKSL